MSYNCGSFVLVYDEDVNVLAQITELDITAYDYVGCDYTQPVTCRVGELVFVCAGWYGNHCALSEKVVAAIRKVAPSATFFVVDGGDNGTMTIECDMPRRIEDTLLAHNTWWKMADVATCFNREEVILGAVYEADEERYVRGLDRYFETFKVEEYDVVDLRDEQWRQSAHRLFWFTLLGVEQTAPVHFGSEYEFGWIQDRIRGESSWYYRQQSQYGWGFTPGGTDRLVVMNPEESSVVRVYLIKDDGWRRYAYNAFLAAMARAAMSRLEEGEEGREILPKIHYATECSWRNFTVTAVQRLRSRRLWRRRPATLQPWWLDVWDETCERSIEFLLMDVNKERGDRGSTD